MPIVAAEQDWRYRLLLARDTRTASARTELATRARKGELVRVARGAYVEHAIWSDLDGDARFRLRVKAVAATASEPLVLSHRSAAALWRLPWFGRWPERVDTLAVRSDGGRSNASLRRHVLRPGTEIVEIDGLVVTSLAQTVADVARTSPFMSGVVVADAALNLRTRRSLPIVVPELGRDDLLARLDGIPRGQGVRRAEDVVAFSNGLSGSPAETVSRVNMDRAGLPVPELQTWFRNPEDGSDWYVDFWWPEFRIIGECDGKGKYFDERRRAGRRPADVVYAEKLREDGLRRQSNGFARWDWDVACSPSALAARLRNAGLRV